MYEFLGARFFSTNKFLFIKKTDFLRRRFTLVFASNDMWNVWMEYEMVDWNGSFANAFSSFSFPPPF